MNATRRLFDGHAAPLLMMGWFVKSDNEAQIKTNLITELFILAGVECVRRTGPRGVTFSDFASNHA